MLTYTLCTPLGSVNAVPTSGDHLHINFEGLVVHRVEYHGGAHFYRYADGSFQLGNEEDDSWKRRHALHVTRTNWTSQANMDASQAAREKLALVLTEIVEKWTSHPAGLGALAVAADDHWEKNVSMAEAKVANAAAALVEAKNELALMRRAPATFSVASMREEGVL